MRPWVLLAALLVASSATTSEQAKKYGAGVYNDTLRAAPFYAQVPAACNLTGRGGWVLLFFETIDGGENALPAPVRITQETSWSIATSDAISSKRSTTSRAEIELRISGRLIVHVTTRPFFS